MFPARADRETRPTQEFPVNNSAQWGPKTSPYSKGSGQRRGLLVLFEFRARSVRWSRGAEVAVIAVFGGRAPRRH